MALNYKHLRYFWMIGKTGSMAKAALALALSPQSISGQVSELEQSLGIKLLRRAGRNLELTDAGKRTLSYAEEIFSLGDELLGAVAAQSQEKTLPFRVGISDSVPKTVAYQMLMPALTLPEQLRLICREGRLQLLLAELSIHRLDLIIADQAVPANLNVRCFSHLLGESKLSIFGAKSLIAKHSAGFPHNLQGAPFLLPGIDAAMRGKLSQWFEREKLHPSIHGEFDDSALMKAFGQAGAGFFAAPSASAKEICSQYQLKVIGEVDALKLQIFAITAERRITHPAVIAIKERSNWG